MPLVEDVRASRTGGPDGSGLVVVEGVWGAAAGGPPPVLFVDDGARRHSLVALDAAPQDDPTAFRATFAVPADLVGHLEEGLALGLGHAEFPLTLEATPVIARRLAEQAGDATPEDVELPLPPSGRFDREDEPRESRGSIAAAILRATEPPPPAPGATVVERSVIAERRAKRSEQIAAVMERRARGAEDTAQELGARIDALEARGRRALRGAATVWRPSSSCRRPPSTSPSSPASRPRPGSPRPSASRRSPTGEGARIAAVRRLPGLEEAARALSEQEVAQPAEPDEPAPEGSTPSPRRWRSCAPTARTSWRRSCRRSRRRSTSTSRRPCRSRSSRTSSAPSTRTRRGSRGPSPRSTSATARPRPSSSRSCCPTSAHGAPRPASTTSTSTAWARCGWSCPPTARAVCSARRRLAATPSSPSRRPRSSSRRSRAAARRLAQRAPRCRHPPRFFLPLARLARKRRRRLALAELVAAGMPLDPGLVIRALASAVPGEWTLGHTFAVTVHVAGSETCRVVVRNGAPLRVLRVDEHGRRSAVVAATTAREPVVAEGAVGGADAVLTLTPRGALPLLAQAEPPADEEPATAIGDLAAATALLGWFDRVQGLAPRA